MNFYILEYWLWTPMELQELILKEKIRKILIALLLDF